MTGGLMTCAQVAKDFNLSQEFIRSACYRGKDYHPLPHIRYGNGEKKFIRIDKEVARKWLMEEMDLNAGAL